MTLRAARLAGLAAVGLAAALPARADEPRSAIPWLSQSIEIIDTPAPPSRAKAGRGRPADDTITVTPLGQVDRDGFGLLPPEQTGLSRALWGQAPAESVRALILGHEDQGVPAARALFHRLLLAETDPPPGPPGKVTVLVARLDRLLGIGALEEAGTLLEVAGPDTPELFRRWFDIGILLDRAEAPCAALRQNPSLSPTLPARVFCLARGGDWNAAEITLTLGEEVGSIPEAERALLARFLDPELFEGEPEPPVPDPLTPLDFLMREAVALPRPPGQLPLAFLHADLGEHVPMRTRIEAAERLWLSGAIGAAALLDAYRSGVPAASGGIWDRATAVQALDAALEPGSGADLAAALAAADAALSPRGLRVALAEGYAARIDAADASRLAPGAQAALVELLLLAGEAEAAAALAGPAPEPRVAALLAIATGAPQPTEGPDDLTDAALEGLQALTPADDREQRMAEMVAAGEQGAAILGALDLLGAGPPIDPPALRAGLLTLRLAGQEATARAIALETLLPGPA